MRCKLPITLAGVAGLAVTVLAIPAARAGVSAPAAVTVSASIGQSPAQIDSYWTRSRLATAKVETFTTSTSARSTVASSNSPAGAATPSTNVPVVKSAKIFPRPGLTKSTLGRLYFTLGKANWVCSASAIYTDLIITAGHCVYDTENGNGWAKNEMFIPGDSRNGAYAPYGRWYGTKEYASSAFTSTARYKNGKLSGDWQFDMGLIKMAANSKKQQVGTALGYEGIRFESHPANLTVVGYPTEKPFTGQSERYCANPNYTTETKYWALTIPCNMTGGASGGAWLSDFSYTTGKGLVTAVTSRVGSGYQYGTQFGHTAYEVWRSAGGVAISPTP